MLSQCVAIIERYDGRDIIKTIRYQRYDMKDTIYADMGGRGEGDGETWGPKTLFGTLSAKRPTTNNNRYLQRRIPPSLKARSGTMPQETSINTHIHIYIYIYIHTHINIEIPPKKNGNLGHMKANKSANVLRPLVRNTFQNASLESCDVTNGGAATC